MHATYPTVASSSLLLGAYPTVFLLLGAYPTVFLLLGAYPTVASSFLLLGTYPTVLRRSIGWPPERVFAELLWLEVDDLPAVDGCLQ
jgi:hypothetical protein